MVWCRKASADAFLPNQLRRQLGMLDNTRRLARDIYLMKLILGTRKFLRVVVGKMDASGNPLVPSRLLLACDLLDLPARILHLVQEENTDVLPSVEVLTKPISGPSHLPIPRPETHQPPARLLSQRFATTCDVPIDSTCGISKIFAARATHW